MMRGIPGIGFDSGGTSELIEHGNTGYLFNDLRSFKKSLYSVTSLEEIFNSIRMQAFDSSTKKFNDVRYCESVDAFVQDVLSMEI
jgi:glycosyltransferase involved in cell wall biosynthesis